MIAFQSAEGKRLAKETGIDPSDPESVVLIENGKIHEKSSAVLAIMKSLKGTGSLIKVLKAIPEKLLDKGYDLVARNRHWMFGRED